MVNHEIDEAQNLVIKNYVNELYFQLQEDDDKSDRDIHQFIVEFDLKRRRASSGEEISSHITGEMVGE